MRLLGAVIVAQNLQSIQNASSVDVTGSYKSPWRPMVSLLTLHEIVTVFLKTICVTFHQLAELILELTWLGTLLHVVICDTNTVNFGVLSH